MLIRSQDKKCIVNLDNIVGIFSVKNLPKDRVILPQYETDIVCYSDRDETSIGRYDSEEKAIKVLDMICAEYQAPIYRIIDGDEIDVYENIMFHMPQDDEVDWSKV